MHTNVTLTPTTNIMEFEVRIGLGIEAGDRVGLVRQTGQQEFQGLTARGAWEFYASIDKAIKGVLYPVVGETEVIVAFGSRD